MTPKYIDIHSHVNFKAFDEDREEVIKRALGNNTWIINVGTQIDTSKKAVELGDVKQKRLMVLGVDRYLVSLGYKQLFASQAFMPPHEKCFCMQPVEATFPDTKRKEYMGTSLEDQFKWIEELNSKQPSCGSIEKVSKKECDTNLKSPPVNTVPGVY